MQPPAGVTFALDREVGARPPRLMRDVGLLGKHAACEDERAELCEVFHRYRRDLMPAIVYDPQAGRDAFTATLRKLREWARAITWRIA